MSDANVKIIIDRLLRESDLVLSGDDSVINVDTEMQNQAGFADYISRTVLTFLNVSSKQRKNWSLSSSVKSKHITQRHGCSVRQSNNFFPFTGATTALKTKPIQR